MNIQKAIAALNQALAADPAAINAVIGNRVACNNALARHPTVQVAVADLPSRKDFTVGALGLINAAVEPLTGKRIAVIIEEGEIKAFAEYNGT